MKIELGKGGNVGRGKATRMDWMLAGKEKNGGGGGGVVVQEQSRIGMSP